MYTDKDVRKHEAPRFVISPFPLISPRQGPDILTGKSAFSQQLQSTVYLSERETKFKTNTRIALNPLSNVENMVISE